MKYRLLFITALVSFFSFTVPIQDDLDNGDTGAMIRANYLFHFASSNDWPEEYHVGTFRIGVLGNDNVYSELVDKYSMKPIGSQPLEIVKVDDKTDIKTLHILFVDATKMSKLSKLKQEVKGESVMFVTHNPGALEAGSVINFKVVNSSIRYELNLEEAKKKNLTIGSKIIQWAVN